MSDRVREGARSSQMKETEGVGGEESVSQSTTRRYISVSWQGCRSSVVDVSEEATEDLREEIISFT